MFLIYDHIWLVGMRYIVMIFISSFGRTFILRADGEWRWGSRGTDIAKASFAFPSILVHGLSYGNLAPW